MRYGYDEGNFPKSLLNSKRHYKISSAWLVLINICNSYPIQEMYMSITLTAKVIIHSFNYAQHQGLLLLLETSF